MRWPKTRESIEYAPGPSNANATALRLVVSNGSIAPWDSENGIEAREHMQYVVATHGVTDPLNIPRKITPVMKSVGPGGSGGKTIG